MDMRLHLVLAFILALISTLSAQCANLSDDSTWGTMVVNDTATGTLYVNENTILCTDTYYFNAAAATAILRMNASNIFLDCNNSILDGVDGNGYGVYITGKENDTVGNCTATHYQHGFYLYNGARYNVLELDTAYNNSGGGIVLSNSNGNTVSNNTVFNNSQHGIYAIYSNNTIVDDNIVYGHNTTSFSSIYLLRSSFSTVENNQINASYRGIWLYAVANNSVSNNDVFTSRTEGIRADYTNDSLFMGNYVDGVAEQQAMQLGYDAYRNNVTGNEFYRAGGAFHILLAYDNYVYSNVMSYSTDGIEIVYVEGNYIFNNTMEGNTNWDFYYSAENASQCDNFIEDNTGTFGLPILFYNESVNISNLEAADIELCDADGSSLSNVTILGNRSNHISITGSDNVAITGAVLNGTSDGLLLFGFSNPAAPIENVTISDVHAADAVWGGLSMTSAKDAAISNFSVNGSKEVGIWMAGNSTGNTFLGITLINASWEPTYYRGSLQIYDSSNVSAGNPQNNTFMGLTIHSTESYVAHWAGLAENFFYNLTLCKDALPQGCIKWDYINLTNSTLNSTNLFLEASFVSMNSSNPGAAQFNKSANITLATDCSEGVLHGVYLKENFSSSAADIVANGTLYAPGYMECSNDYLTFSAASFSAYALEDGTLNLTLLPSNSVLPHVETTASCDSSNPSVMLELYRNGELVANGTSHVDDVQALPTGTYEYICNTTNSSASNVTGTLRVRASNVGGSSSPVGISVSGEEVVGNTLTITVRDGSTPVDGAEVRVLYWSNGILNAINLGNTNSDGEVEFTPSLAGGYTVEATTAGYGAVEFAFSVEAAEVQGETGTGQETGCGNGCPAGYGCINVQCVRIGGQQGTPSDEGIGTGGILPVVASPAWESTEETPADREVRSASGQAASPSGEAGEPINPLVIIVPLVLAAALVLLSRRRKRA